MLLREGLHVVSASCTVFFYFIYFIYYDIFSVVSVFIMSSYYMTAYE